MFSHNMVTEETRAVHPNSGPDRLLRYMMVSGHVENAACVAGQSESSRLAEAASQKLRVA